MSPLHSKSQRPKTSLVPRDFFFPFGNKLVTSGYIEPDQLKLALKKKEQSNKSLINILEELTQRKLPSELVRQYKKHQLFELKVLYGVDCVDPEINTIASNQMAILIEEIVTIATCRRYKLLPLRIEESRLLVAMVNPDDLEAYDELRRILNNYSKEKLTLQRMVITQEDYHQLLEGYKEAESERDKERQEIIKQRKEERSNDVTQLVDKLFDDSEQKTVDDSDAEDIDAEEGDQDSPPIITLVNKILVKALKEGTSDIHIEPQEENLRVRFRKDGVLTEAFPPLPKKIITSIVARFKIMADLDIAERRMPQDGKIRRIFQGRKVDFRVNSLPSRYGEKVVLRILDNSATQLGLDKLITSQGSLDLVRDLASRPFGLILVTGPTGSGKSTTLYSILAERNSPRVNISTAEDPIEYSLPGITQVQVIREKNMDFASILRAFLRQDPDVILVGETRDKETAKTAIEAALTGHLVLTTLHTNDAAGAIARLDEMGVEPFMISGALLGVLAQRLMRRVCSECKIAYQPSQEELARFGLSSTAKQKLTIYKAKSLTLEEVQEAKSKKTLCSKCNGVGYKGRVGVYEVMKMTEDLQNLINQGASTDRIKEKAVEEGMITLLAYSLNLVVEGYTTLEEIERVTFTDSGLEAERKAKRKTSLTCKTCNAGLQPEWLDCPYCMTPRFQEDI